MLLADGYEPARVAKQLSVLIREDVLLDRPLMKRDISFPLLRKLIDVPSSIEPNIDLEITLLETIDDNLSTVHSIPAREITPNLSNSVKPVKINSNENSKVGSEIASQKDKLKEKSTPQSSKATIADPNKLWNQLLEVIK